MSQLSISDVEFGAKRKQTRRDKFLAEMDKVVPWARLTALSDPAMEEALYDMQSMRQFAGLSLTRGGIPEETTILNSRHLLEEHKLANRFLEEINTMLAERGLLHCWRHFHRSTNRDQECQWQTRP